MTIDIDTLTEAELIDLHHRIVARLRFLQEGRAHAAMLAFRVGERVSFQPAGQPLRTGVITKYNRKTVTVLTEDGQHWNLAPTFLRTVTPRRGYLHAHHRAGHSSPAKPRKGHRA